MELRMCICVFVHISVMCIYTYKSFKQQQKLLFIDYLFNVHLSGLNVSTNNPNFKKNHIWLYDASWYFWVWKTPLSFLLLLFKIVIASIFNFEIDSLEEYPSATNVETSFICFKPQFYKKSSFYHFLWSRTP